MSPAIDADSLRWFTTVSLSEALEEPDMAKKIQQVLITPGDTGVSVCFVEDSNHKEIHYRSSLSDALDLVHDRMRAVIIDNGV